MIKEGIKVILLTNEKHESENISWSNHQGLLVGNTYIGTRVLPSGKWIEITYNNYTFQHPIEKFKIITIAKKDHLPEWL